MLKKDFEAVNKILNGKSVDYKPVTKMLEKFETFEEVDEHME